MRRWISRAFVAITALAGVYLISVAVLIAQRPPSPNWRQLHGLHHLAGTSFVTFDQAAIGSYTTDQPDHLAAALGAAGIVLLGPLTLMAIAGVRRRRRA